MNNKQNNNNRTLLDAQRGNVGGQYQDFISGARRDVDQARGDDKNLRDDLYNRYTSNNNFMPTGMTPNSKGWFDLPEDASGIGSGSAAGGDFSQAKAGYGKFAETGGINREDFNPALDSYKGFMSNGGVGASEADAWRHRATSMVPAFYDKFKNSLQRRSNVQGGYSPGFDSQMAEIGRQAGREGFEASRGVEADIADKMQQGRMFGTSGYGSLMSDITGKEQSGRLAGLGGLKGIGDSEQSNSQFNAGLGEQRAGRNQQMQQFLQEMFSSGGKANAAGLQGLYSSAPGASGQAQGNLLSGLGGMSQNDLSNLAMRLGIKDRSWMDLLPALTGVAGSAFGAFSNPSSGRK